MITDGNPITSVNRADKRRPPPCPRPAAPLRSPDPLTKPALLSWPPRPALLTLAQSRASWFGGWAGSPQCRLPSLLVQSLGFLSHNPIFHAQLFPSRPLPCLSLSLSLSPDPARSLLSSSGLFPRVSSSHWSLSPLPRQSSAVSCCYAALWLRLRR